MISRREFLKFSLASTLTAYCNLSFSKDKNRKILIFIDLFGGSDGLNMLVPYTDENYYKARPNIAIDEKELLKISNFYGVNPNLKDTYYSWFENNNAVFFPRAGQETTSRSHFLATDIMGNGNNQNRSKDGFLGRLAEVLGNSDGISFTENEKTFTKSSKIVIPSIGVSQIDGKYLEYQQENKFNEFKDNYIAVSRNNEVIKTIDKNSLSQKRTNLGKISDYINNSNVEFVFYENNGWDTHSNQTRRLNLKLKELNRELLELKVGLGDNWNNTAIIVMSEFGRTLKDNGDGSEHGYGNLISIFGGLIKESKIIGGEDKLLDGNLHENRELHVEYSYRDILREMIREMYNLNDEQLNYVFPSSKKLNFSILGY